MDPRLSPSVASVALVNRAPLSYSPLSTLPFHCSDVTFSGSYSQRFLIVLASTTMSDLNFSSDKHKT